MKYKYPHLHNLKKTNHKLHPNKKYTTNTTTTNTVNHKLHPNKKYTTNTTTTNTTTTINHKLHPNKNIKNNIDQNKTITNKKMVLSRNKKNPTRVKVTGFEKSKSLGIIFHNLNNKNIKNKYDIINKFIGDIYYINLLSRKDRNNIMSKHLNNLKLPFKRFNAFTPDMDNIDAFKDNNPQINFSFINKQPNNINSWVKGTIGCFFSHYYLMKELLQIQNPKKYYLILEDDCIPSIDHIYVSVLFAEKFNDLDILRLNSFCNDIVSASLLGWKIDRNHFHLTHEEKCLKVDGGTHFVFIKHSSIPKIITFLESYPLFFIDGMYNTKELNSYWYHFGNNIRYHSPSSIKRTESNKKNSNKLLLRLK